MVLLAVSMLFMSLIFQSSKFMHSRSHTHTHTHIRMLLYLVHSKHINTCTYSKVATLCAFSLLFLFSRSNLANKLCSVLGGSRDYCYIVHLQTWNGVYRQTKTNTEAKDFMMLVVQGLYRRDFIHDYIVH